MRAKLAFFLALAAFACEPAAFAQSQQPIAGCAHADGSGDFEQQISGCAAAIQSGQWSGPNLARAYADRGAGYRAKGDLDRARADFDEAIRIDPTYAAAYDSRGLVWMAKGDVDRAIDDFDQAIKRDPDFMLAYRHRGDAYQAQARSLYAIVDYGAALQLDPKNAATFVARGIAYYYWRQPDNASADFDHATDLDPADATAALWAEIARRRIGEPSELAQASKKIDLAKWPGPIVSLFLGRSTMEAARAGAEDGKGAALQDRICDLNFFAGQLAAMRGDKAEALRLYRVTSAECGANPNSRAASAAEIAALGASP